MAAKPVNQLQEEMDSRPKPQAATHPFFKKTSEKILEKKLAQELNPPIPISEPDLPAPKPKRQRRKASPPPEPRSRRSKILQLSEPESAPPLETSPPPFLPSIRTDIDPVTAAAPPSPPPQSSPPEPSTPIEVDAEIDLNESRKKRRRMTPTPPISSASFHIEYDAETGSILDSSPSVNHIRPITAGSQTSESSTASSQVSYNDGRLTIKAGGKIKPDDLLPSPKPKDTPRRSGRTRKVPTEVISISSSPSPKSADLGEMGRRVNWRARVEDRTTLVIKSSPPPESPPKKVVKNAFALLGKKKEGPLVKPREEKLPEPSKEPEKPNALAMLGKKPVKPKDEPEKPNVFDILGKKPVEKPEETGKRPSRRSKKTVSYYEDPRALLMQDIDDHDEPEQPTVMRIGPPSPSKAKAEPAKPPSKPPKTSAKSSHPFFSATGRKNMVKTAKPLTDAEPPEAPPPAPADRKPISSGFTTFRPTTFKHAVKAPGMIEPAWPSKETAHVRGFEPTYLDFEPTIPRNRKLKNRVIGIDPKESIFHRLCADLEIPSLAADISSSDYPERSYRHVAPEVRIPKRIVTTGSQLQDMVRTRVNARLPHPKALSHAMLIDSDSDSASDMRMGTAKVHPALLHLYIRIRDELTAFDQNQYEAVPWEVKYAPRTWREVLQSVKEMEILKNWLLGLRTELFDVPNDKKRKSNKDGAKVQAKKKRKKKDDDLDGFVVSSQEERNDMDEITDPDSEEGDWTSATAKPKKSTIRAGDRFLNAEIFGDEIKTANAVLISGPNGCGKTAAIYAVAKQLGYTVFEVSPSARRNGKDLLDQVGDMSRNHLVHSAKATADLSNPFARAKAARERAETPTSVNEDQSRGQQQSLILLEEVDILFEEDKSFWSSVQTLMSKSKRPIIMTCNDESLIPLDTLSLHAILRFTQPQHDLMVDHLLLMAANEGHLLQRPVVDNLVTSNNRDLRKCIMDLSFHCRIGVGDRTGTLAWQIIRWPPGCDIAPNGEITRVVSMDTISDGAGWMDNAKGAKIEDQWEQAWDEFDLNIAEEDAGLEGCFCGMEERMRENYGLEKGQAWEIMDFFFDSRSAADAFSLGVMGDGFKEPIDTTAPRRPEKLLASDPLGYTILTTPPKSQPSSLLPLVLTSLHLSWLSLSSSTAHFTNYPPTPNRSTLLSATTTRHSAAATTITLSEMKSLFSPFWSYNPMFGSPVVGMNQCAQGGRVLVEEVAPMVRGVVRRDVEEEMRRRGGEMKGGRLRRKGRVTRRAKEERWWRGVGGEVVATGGEWDAAVGEEGERKWKELVDMGVGEGESEEDDILP